MTFRRSATIVMLALSLLCFFAPAYSATQAPFDFSDFRKLPVLNEGRIKPLGSLARTHLKEIAGRPDIDGMSADFILAEALFDPANAALRKVFNIPDPEMRRMLGLDETEKFYSPAELLHAFIPHGNAVKEAISADQKTLTPQQNQMLNLYDDLTRYHVLLRSFSMILPLNLNVPQHYNASSTAPVNYLDLFKKHPVILEDVKAVMRRKGDNPGAYTAEEQSLAGLAMALDQIREGGEHNDFLRVIPADQDWQSPWQSVLQGGTPEQAKFLGGWQALANAWQAGDATQWQNAAKTLLTSYKSDDQYDIARIQAELAYRIFDPYKISLAFYGLGLILMAAHFIKKPLTSSDIAKTKGTKSFFLPLLFFVAAAALMFHAAGIAARIYILNRPPVGTLYESMLFVSWICGFTGLWAGWKKKQILYVFSGLFSAVLLLMMAPFLLQKGESMDMLVAVLNTNFWLATHVLCITIGYGVCIVTACLAHGRLFFATGLLQRFYSPSPEMLQRLDRSLASFSIAALFFTTVGTILGGIWADQSWGRFWGWDPKENGALLIVLWLIWLQHGRMAGHFKPLSYAAGLALLNIVVALAWFGVNLLATGLHSYGFISGIATALAVFCTAELLLIAGLYCLTKRSKNITS